MALNYNYIDAFINKLYISKMVDQILGSNPVTLRMLGKAKSRRGGKKIDITPLFYVADTNSGSYGRWDQATYTFQPKDTVAEFDWKYNRQFIIIDHIDELENAGEGKIADLIDTEIKQCTSSFKSAIGTQMYSDGTGNGSKDITGIRAAIDDSTSVDSYGGITRSEETWWKSKYDYNSGTDRALTIKLMQAMWGLCKKGEDSSDTPTLIPTTQELFDKYASILDVSRQRGDEEMGKAGFQNLLFMGKPLVVDSHCPAGFMHFINENHLYYMKHPDEYFKYVPFAYKVDQEVMVAKIRLAGNLVQDECRKSGVIRSLDADL